VSELRIRRAHRRDQAALAALGGWPGIEESERRSIRLYRNVVSDLAYDLYVAEEDGAPVGLVAVSYVRSLPLGGQRATLEDLVVRADRRGAGVGRRLLDFVIGRARRRGARTFEARPPDAAAERFLERAGFEPEGRRYRIALPPSPA
jgi:GNAT superfamily N-acetyltransferase